MSYNCPPSSTNGLRRDALLSFSGSLSLGAGERRGRVTGGLDGDTRPSTTHRRSTVDVADAVSAADWPGWNSPTCHECEHSRPRCRPIPAGCWRCSSGQQAGRAIYPHAPTTRQPPGPSDCSEERPVDEAVGRRSATPRPPAPAEGGDDQGCSAASSTLARVLRAPDWVRHVTTTTGRHREVPPQYTTGPHTAGSTTSSRDAADSHVTRAIMEAAGGHRPARSR